jgi:hypothetical protein
MIATGMGLLFVTETASYTSGLPGVYVTESSGVSFVFVVHPFV